MEMLLKKLWRPKRYQIKTTPALVQESMVKEQTLTHMTLIQTLNLLPIIQETLVIKVNLRQRRTKQCQLQVSEIVMKVQ